MFRKKTSIHLPEVEQGYISFLLWTVNKQPREMRERIAELCREITPEGEDWRILYKALTDRYRTLESVAMEYYMQRKKLSRWRAAFYEAYAKRYLKVSS